MSLDIETRLNYWTKVFERKYDQYSASERYVRQELLVEIRRNLENPQFKARSIAELERIMAPDLGPLYLTMSLEQTE